MLGTSADTSADRASTCACWSFRSRSSCPCASTHIAATPGGANRTAHANPSDTRWFVTVFRMTQNRASGWWSEAHAHHAGSRHVSINTCSTRHSERQSRAESPHRTRNTSSRRTNKFPVNSKGGACVCPWHATQYASRATFSDPHRLHTMHGETQRIICVFTIDSDAVCRQGALRRHNLCVGEAQRHDLRPHVGYRIAFQHELHDLAPRLFRMHDGLEQEPRSPQLTVTAILVTMHCLRAQALVHDCVPLCNRTMRLKVKHGIALQNDDVPMCHDVNCADLRLVRQRNTVRRALCHIRASHDVIIASWCSINTTFFF